MLDRALYRAGAPTTSGRAARPSQPCLRLAPSLVSPSPPRPPPWLRKLHVCDIDCGTASATAVIAARQRALRLGLEGLRHGCTQFQDEQAAARGRPDGAAAPLGIRSYSCTRPRQAPRARKAKGRKHRAAAGQPAKSWQPGRLLLAVPLPTLRR